MHIVLPTFTILHQFWITDIHIIEKSSQEGNGAKYRDSLLLTYGIS